MAGPEPGFEPGTEDPQSHMLPGYTIRAISMCAQGSSFLYHKHFFFFYYDTDYSF